MAKPRSERSAHALTAARAADHGEVRIVKINGAMLSDIADQIEALEGLGWSPNTGYAILYAWLEAETLERHQPPFVPAERRWS